MYIYVLCFCFSGFPANVKKFLENKEEDPPEQQEWSSSLDQEDSPELSHIKEEQEELWTRKEGEQLRRLEEADIKFTFTPVPAKRDGNDEEEPQSSELHQRQTAEMRDDADCGGSEPVRDFGRRHLQAAGHKTSHSNDGVKQSGESQLGFDSDMGCNVAKTYSSSSEFGQRLGSKDRLQIHMSCRTGEKTFTCQFCGKNFTKSSNLTTHLRVHTGEKPFTCSVCNASFSLRCTLVNHMRVHTGEKPFGCSVCGKRFSKKANLTTHMALHTEEKPFKCSVCDKRFTWHSQVKNHKCADGSR